MHRSRRLTTVYLIFNRKDKFLNLNYLPRNIWRKMVTYIIHFYYLINLKKVNGNHGLRFYWNFDKARLWNLTWVLHSGIIFDAPTHQPPLFFCFFIFFHNSCNNIITYELPKILHVQIWWHNWYFFFCACLWIWNWMVKLVQIDSLLNNRLVRVDFSKVLAPRLKSTY